MLFSAGRRDPLSSPMSPSPQPHPDGLARFAARVEAGGITLPMLPEVPRRLASAAASQSGDAKGLAELIRRDPGVAGRLLRVANSAAFGSAVPIVSLQQAVVRLGLDAVRRIALAISLEAHVFRVPGFEEAVRAQFELALGAAWFAQELARQRRLPVEEAFMAGLFHDIGIPAVVQAAVADDLARDQVLTAADQHHATVGAHIASEWGLSPRLVCVARHHHAPAEAGEVTGLCRLVLLADQLAGAVLSGDGTPELSDLTLDPDTLSTLGLYPDDLAQLLGRAEFVRAFVRGVSQ